MSSSHRPVLIPCAALAALLSSTGCGGRTANGGSDGVGTDDDAGTTSQAGDEAGDEAGDGDCPPGGCLDLEEDPPPPPTSGTPRLVVAFGRPNGAFATPRRYDESTRSISAMTVAGKSLLVTREEYFMSILDFSGRGLERLPAFLPHPPSAEIHDVVTLNLDADPDDELLVIFADGELSTVDDLDANPTVEQLESSWLADRYGGAAAADFDGDGVDELLVVGTDGDCALGGCEQVTSWIDPGGDPLLVPFPGGGGVAAGRFDAAPGVDLFLGGTLFPGDGAQLPSAAEGQSASYQLDQVLAVGDFDGDGLDEIVASANGRDDIRYIDAPVDITHAGAIEVAGVGVYCTHGDIDGEGRESLLCVDADPDGDARWIYRTDMAPSPTTTPLFELCRACSVVNWGYGNATALADLDGDGYLDFVAIIRNELPSD